MAVAVIKASLSRRALFDHRRQGPRLGSTSARHTLRFGAQHAQLSHRLTATSIETIY